MTQPTPSTHHLTTIGGVTQWALNPESDWATRKARQDQAAMETKLLKQAEQIVSMRWFH